MLITLFPVFVACFGSATETSLRCADCAEIQVARMIDGDTLDTSRGRIRLFGVHTLERGERYGSEATDRLK